MARGMRLSASRISAIVKKVFSNGNVFSEMKQMHEAKENRSAIIKQQILYLLEHRAFMDSLDHVVTYIDQ